MRSGTGRRCSLPQTEVPHTRRFGRRRAELCVCVCVCERESVRFRRTRGKGKGRGRGERQAARAGMGSDMRWRKPQLMDGWMGPGHWAAGPAEETLEARISPCIYTSPDKPIHKVLANILVSLLVPLISSSVLVRSRLLIRGTWWWGRSPRAGGFFWSEGIGWGWLVGAG